MTFDSVLRNRIRTHPLRKMRIHDYQDTDPPPGVSRKKVPPLMAIKALTPSSLMAIGTFFLVLV